MLGLIEVIPNFFRVVGVIAIHDPSFIPTPHSDVIKPTSCIIISRNGSLSHPERLEGGLLGEVRLSGR